MPIVLSFPAARPIFFCFLPIEKTRVARAAPRRFFNARAAVPFIASSRRSHFLLIRCASPPRARSPSSREFAGASVKAIATP